MKTLNFVIAFCMVMLSTSYAQTDNQNYSLKIEGQIAVTTNGKAAFINMGGPGVKFVFPKFAVSVNMLPSLKFEEEAPKPIVTPILGVGPQIYFLKNKRLVLSFPCYYHISKNSWIVSAGLGYGFSYFQTKKQN